MTKPFIMICIMTLLLGSFCSNLGAQEKPSPQMTERPSLEVRELYKKGRNLYSQGKTEEAIAIYKKIIDLDPEFDFAYGSLAYCLDEQKQFKEAVTMYIKAIKLKPKDDFYHGQLGLTYNKMNEVDKAVAEYKMAIELNPNEWTYHYNYSIALSRDRKDLDGAYTELEKALKLCNNPKAKMKIKDAMEKIKEARKEKK